MMTYYVCAKLNPRQSVVHGAYAAEAEAAQMSAWIYRRYRQTSVVVCQILTERPANADTWLIYDEPPTHRNLLREGITA